MGWDIARSRYCTTSFVKSLYADFLKDGLFNSRLFNAPKAKKNQCYLKKSHYMNYHTLKEAKKLVGCNFMPSKNKNPFIFNLMFKHKLSFRDLVDTCVGWE